MQRGQRLFRRGSVTHFLSNPADETTSRTHTSVVRGAQADDAEAWTTLVRVYSRRVYRWCRIASLQPADSANVVQDVFRAVARKIGDFRRDRDGDTFRGWLRRITDNKIRDHHRAKRRELAHACGGTDAYRELVNCPEGSSLPSDIRDDVNAAASGSALARALCTQIRNEFSERDWQIFWRIVIDGQSASEAAEDFGVSANAARLVKMRVLRRCRQLLATRSRSEPGPE
jgi:RNA polymerase sigma-70 factor, ECF subfamily